MRKSISFILMFGYILILSGCWTLPPDENVFENEGESNEEIAIDVDDTVTLQEAITNTQSGILDQFWFRTHIANNIGKRRNTHMTLNGIVVAKEGYYMRNTLLTEPYEYFRFGNNIYIRNKGNWYRGREEALPFDPSYGYQYWEPVIEEAVIVGQDEVLSVPTIVHELKLSGKEMLELDTPFFTDWQNSDLNSLDFVLEETNIRVKFYVGDVTKSSDQREVLPIIYKYQTLIDMPVPGAGFMNQEVQHFIFRVNDHRVELPSVEEVEKYLIEIDPSDFEDLEESEE